MVRVNRPGELQKNYETMLALDVTQVCVPSATVSNTFLEV